VEPEHFSHREPDPADPADTSKATNGWVRMIDPEGRLVSVGQRERSGALHPSVVLI
jgi:hypothetical protein